MNPLELRPLSLGDILDRTFSLYRSNFLLFVALAGIPRLPLLVVALVNLQLPVQNLGIAATLGFSGLTIVLSLLAYLFSQGGAVLAVSELYLGRPASVSDTLRRVMDELGPLFGVLILNGLAVGVGMVFLIVPGIYLMCRLFVCVPAAVIEKKGPIDSLSRSFALTQAAAGRSFVIFLLYLVMAIGFGVIASAPATAFAIGGGNRAALPASIASMQALLSTGFEVILTPVLLIATAIYYYDLRVRKEAFDIQVMMDPEGANVPRPSLRSIVPES